MTINSKWYLILFLVPLAAVMGFSAVMAVNISRISQQVISVENKLSADLILMQNKFYSDFNILEQEIVTNLNSVQDSLISDIAALEQEIISGLLDIEELLVRDLSTSKQEILANFITLMDDVKLDMDDVKLDMLEEDQQLTEDINSVKESFVRDVAVLGEDFLIELSRVERSLMTDVEKLSSSVTDKSDQLAQVDHLIGELSDMSAGLVTEIEDSNRLLGERIDIVGLRLDEVYSEFTNEHSDLGQRITSQDVEFSRESKQNLDAQDNLFSSIAGLSSDILDLSSGVLELSNAHRELNDDTVELMAKLNRSTLDAVSIYERTIDSVVDILESGKTTASGFIYGAQANYVLTAWHAVRNSLNPSVRLSDGTNIKARVIATKRSEDVAILKMEQSVDAEPLFLADSSELLIGQPVLLLGSPAGLTGSTTTGVISGIGRAKEDFDDDSFTFWHHPTNLVQIDAAANPGNSGGPVLNTNGEVIGIMSFILTWGESGGSSGVNFAVASDVVKQFVDSVIR